MSSGDLIYGLELQSRALSPQYGEGNEVRFFVATNSLKPTNQIHLIECNEENSTIKSRVFEHTMGEVWKLNSSPHDAQLLSSCYNVHKGAQIQTRTALLTIPEDIDISTKSEFLPWARVEVLETEVPKYINRLINSAELPSRLIVGLVNNIESRHRLLS